MKDLKAGLEQTKTTAEFRRIPVGAPVRKLEAPEIPGYRLYWFKGTEERIQRAREGGYEFVSRKELRTNSVSLGSDTAADGSTDLGSGVSIVAGGELDNNNQPIRMVLMKIKQEWYNEDQFLAEERTGQVAAALRGGMLGAEADRDVSKRYVDKARTSIPNLFTPKRSAAA